MFSRPQSVFLATDKVDKRFSFVGIVCLLIILVPDIGNSWNSPGHKLQFPGPPTSNSIGTQELATAESQPQPKFHIITPTSSIVRDACVTDTPGTHWQSVRKWHVVILVPSSRKSQKSHAPPTLNFLERQSSPRAKSHTRPNLNFKSRAQRYILPNTPSLSSTYDINRFTGNRYSFVPRLCCSHRPIHSVRGTSLVIIPRNWEIFVIPPTTHRKLHQECRALPSANSPAPQFKFQNTTAIFNPTMDAKPWHGQ